jgi:hypothetical protein
VVIPPRSTVPPSYELGPPTRRDRHWGIITFQGPWAWQTVAAYEQRSLIETTISRDKTLIGHRPGAHGFAARQTQAAVGVAVLNRILAAGRPKSVRGQAALT